jgi:Flp pilus assembly pilin Flp
MVKNQKKQREALKGMREFIQEEEGMGTVEIILIIVVLIGLVIIFKDQLRSLVNTVFEKITQDSNTVMS